MESSFCSVFCVIAPVCLNVDSHLLILHISFIIISKSCVLLRRTPFHSKKHIFHSRILEFGVAIYHAQRAIYLRYYWYMSFLWDEKTSELVAD